MEHSTLEEIVGTVMRLLHASGVPLWIIILAIVALAVAAVLAPKALGAAWTFLKNIKPQPAPVVDEGGVQPPGVALPPAPGGGAVLPTDPANPGGGETGGSG